MSLNRFDFIGHIGRDCVVNMVDGKPVGNISVAITKKINNTDYTQWVDASIWDKEKLYPYLKKGTLVYVSGEVSANLFKKQDGTSGVSLKVNAKTLHLLGGQKQNEGQQGYQPQQQVQSQSNISVTSTGFDANSSSEDDLPF